MTKVNLETTYVEAQSKFDAGFFRIGIDQLSSDIPTTEFLVEPNPHAEGQFKLVVALDSDEVNGGQDRLRKTVQSLIEHSGIDGLEINTSTHRNSDSIVLKSENPEDITRVAEALSTNVDLGQGQTVYGIIDSSVVTAVADEVSQAMGGKEYGFDDEPKQVVPYLVSNETHEMSITASSDAERKYLVAKSNIVGTTIEQISSESQYAANKSGEDIHVEFTRVDIAESKVNAVSSQLSKNGLDVERHGNHLNISAPIQEVSAVLKEVGLIPDSLHSSIATQRAELKGDFSTAADVASISDVAQLRVLPTTPGLVN